MLGKRLANRQMRPYPCLVKLLRALVLICLGLGLFVQVAAQASAMPVSPSENSADCAEMAQSMPEHMDVDRDGSDQTGPCRDMSLDCLVAMNCLSPLMLTGADMGALHSPIITSSYLSSLADRLQNMPMPPESPPPQFLLTV